jgi:hypothetical protein
MDAQLRLLTSPDQVERAEHDDAPALETGPVSWRLSASTRATGREGIEHARAALRRAVPPAADDRDDHRHQPSAA